MTSFLKELANEASVTAVAEVPGAAPAPAKMAVEHLNLFYGDFQGLRDIKMCIRDSTYDEAARVIAGGKALLVAEKLADEDALSYAMDATADEWSLRDYVAKGIEVLGAGDAGFFMMCEGGKIDWACHCLLYTSWARRTAACSRSTWPRPSTC